MVTFFFFFLFSFSFLLFFVCGQAVDFFRPKMERARDLSGGFFSPAVSGSWVLP